MCSTVVFSSIVMLAPKYILIIIDFVKVNSKHIVHGVYTNNQSHQSDSDEV